MACSNDTTKSQPWKKNWPPRDDACIEGIEYGVEKGQTVVVDGTSAPLKLTKTQPWKNSWPPQESDGQKDTCARGIEFGVKEGETVVVDGTSANIKPLQGATGNSD
ncbi:hypothetical protein CPLU01_12843 [Colletotrichum plurivorum]|uniref:Uncharacterized protein n=1 Tax=Colletotrichum plurivorum TaxID=2175906 RepID=A0A8H6JWR4_9PEZI|nr:hypothetical protein CPLU01_12843 [Colletotrichum plurivorum]